MEGREEGGEAGMPSWTVTPIMGREEGRQDPRTPPGWEEEQGSPREPSSSGLSKRGKDVGVLRGYLLPPLLPAAWVSRVLMSPWRQGRGQR